MNFFRLRGNGNIVTFSELQDLNPQIFIPEGASAQFLDAMDVDIVHDAAFPVFSPGEFLVRDQVILDESVWTYTWKVVSPTTEDATRLLAAHKAQTIQDIDRGTDIIYGTVVGNRGNEYLMAETQANAYKDAGYTGTVPSYVQSYATAKSQTAQWAADDILATAGAWKVAEENIRATRLLIKEQTRNATTVAEVNALNAQWTTYVDTMLANLVT